MQKDFDPRSVKPNRFRIFWNLIPVSLIVIADEITKFFALQRLPDEGSLVRPGILSFAIHKNLGIAFDIPFRIPFIIFISIVIGLFLLQVAKANLKRHPMISFASLTIIIGALGNLYDRIVYEFTVDYIILFGRLAINLSDIVIVSGVIMLLMTSRRSRRHKRIHPDEPER